MKLFSKVLESWKDEKAFEKRLADGLAAMEISGYIKEKNNRRLKKIIRQGLSGSCCPLQAGSVGAVGLARQRTDDLCPFAGQL